VEHVLLRLRPEPLHVAPALLFLTPPRGRDDIPRIMNGLGVAILSTSRGILTDHEARRAGIGGEVLCTVF
jgi:hypothetical protein